MQALQLRHQGNILLCVLTVVVETVICIESARCQSQLFLVLAIRLSEYIRATYSLKIEIAFQNEETWLSLPRHWKRESHVVTLNLPRRCRSPRTWNTPVVFPKCVGWDLDWKSSTRSLSWCPQQMPAKQAATLLTIPQSRSSAVKIQN